MLELRKGKGEKPSTARYAGHILPLVSAAHPQGSSDSEDLENKQF